MTPNEFIGKWEALPARQRDKLTALALGYTTRSFFVYDEYVWKLISPEGTEVPIACAPCVHTEKDLWDDYCPRFTRFSPDCGAFVEVWRQSWDFGMWTGRFAFDWCLSLKIGYSFAPDSEEFPGLFDCWYGRPNAPDDLCCAYVYAKGNTEGWERFEEVLNGSA